jgi:hypothetical protein
VIPNTLLGLLVFAASLGPGYIFVRVAETRDPRPERSTLLELAELVFVGSAASAAAFSLGFIVAEATGWVDLDRLAAAGATDYMLNNPYRGFSFLVAVLGITYVGTWLVAKHLLYRGRPRPVLLHPIWHEVLWDDSGAKRVFVTVELRDGRKVAGYASAYTSQDVSPEDKELVLQRPISATVPQDPRVVWLDDDHVLVPGSQIALLSVKYQDAGTPTTTG